jgi:uncharacterized protein YjbI with pentapeptide repeats
LEDIGFDATFFFEANFSGVTTNGGIRLGRQLLLLPPQSGITPPTISFRKASLVDVNFANSNLSYVIFAGAKLSHINFNDARIIAADFTHAQLDNQSLNSLQNAILCHVILPDATVSNARLCSLERGQ